jgi:2-methylcitrate dehydratase
MLTPWDYGKQELVDKNTRSLMEKIEFEHGGKEFDEKYPDGIPTSVIIHLAEGAQLSTDIVMYPPGHSRNTTSDLKGILRYKFAIMGKMGLEDNELKAVLERLENFENLTSKDLQGVYNCQINYAKEPLD